MPYNPQIHHRRSIRLKGYDYSREGLYFVTMCVKDRKCLFGHVSDGEMLLNDVGKIADEYLKNIPDHFPQAEMGEFIVMPNHVHCILVLRESPDGKRNPVGSRHVVSPQDKKNNIIGTRHVVSQRNESQPNSNHNQFSKPIAGSVSVIIQQYKSSVKRWCNKNNHKYFQWQSRFYDHIIRTQRSYYAISRYILNNPAKWEGDNFFI